MEKPMDAKIIEAWELYRQQRKIETRKTIQRNIKEIRVKKGKTQAVVAKVLGVSKTTVASWEQGLSLPDLPTLSFLALYFEVDVNDFLPKYAPD